jgi:NAD(P)-dependent dehydrogenase (short-subunit alcohol dehydrogenase family)
MSPPVTAAPLAGKTILITGATRGIGFSAARALAARGAGIIVHGRDPGRVDATLKALTSIATGADHTGVVADLGSLDEVRAMAAEVDARHARLDVLINNAGLTTLRREETDDGFERVFAVNHLAPFLLTQLLLDKLMASSPARIVNVASNAHHRAAFDIDDLNWQKRRYNALGAYGATKLANILFTRELARRLDGTGVTANSLHPGVVATHIFAGLGVLGALFGVAARPFLLSPSRGAQTTVYLAAADDVTGASGQYFNRCQQTEPAPAAQDDVMARRLWQISEKLVG